MKILDRYILRQFFINFAILSVVFLSLFLVVDLIVTLDEFLQAGQRWSGRYGGTLPATLVVIADYYGPMLVLIYAFCSGVPVLGAMGFTLASLQRSREATAVVASGVSLYRLAAPIVIAGILLNGAALPLQELVIPPLSEKLSRSKSDLKRAEVEGVSLRLVPDESGDLLSAASFDPVHGMLRDVTIHKRTDAGLLERRIGATQAYWDEARDGWGLVQGMAAEVGDLDAALQGTLHTQPREVEFFATGLSPKVLTVTRQSGLYPWFLSMGELQQLQINGAVEPAQQREITRILWGRFSLLVVNVLMLVMGLAFFLQIGHPNLLTQAVRAAGVCLPVWGGGLLVLFTGMGGLNPVATAWLPVVIYLPVSAVLLQFVRT